VKIEDDEYWLVHALKLAEQAAQQGEVPVGAVVVRGNQLLGEGWNQPISSNDPTAHAEVIALRQAALQAGNYRLPETTLYVTLEPCAMCAGAIIQARVKRVVFGVSDPRAGAVSSVFNILQEPRLNHRVDYLGDVLTKPCAKLLQDFFKARRAG
jgi:tRNA(adenine34) deaminase